MKKTSAQQHADLEDVSRPVGDRIIRTCWSLFGERRNSVRSLPSCSYFTAKVYDLPDTFYARGSLAYILERHPVEVRDACIVFVEGEKPRIDVDVFKHNSGRWGTQEPHAYEPGARTAHEFAKIARQRAVEENVTLPFTWSRDEKFLGEIATRMLTYCPTPLEIEIDFKGDGYKLKFKGMEHFSLSFLVYVLEEFGGCIQDVLFDVGDKSAMFHVVKDEATPWPTRDIRSDGRAKKRFRSP